MTVEVWWRGAYFTGASWDLPYSSSAFNLGSTIGTFQTSGTVEVRIYVGGSFAGAFSASVAP